MILSKRLLFVLVYFVFALPTYAASISKLPVIQNSTDEKASLTLAVGADVKSCSSSLQGCTIQITQSNTSCLTQPGSITISNNSKIIAKNIKASSTNANFTNYVIQNNGCPAALAPGHSCTISFTTNTNVAFTIPNVQVKGSNTNTTFFNINAIQCSLSSILTVSPSTVQILNVEGGPLVFTVHNSGSGSAYNVLVTSPWTNVNITPTNCGELAAGADCLISLESNFPNTANRLSISSNNTSTILTPYIAFNYQDGLVFSANSNQAKVVTQTDVSGPIQWYNGSSIDVNATSLTDGAFNTEQIINAQGSGTYAASECVNNPFGNWYLPAICEWSNLDNGCTIDNIYSNLVALGFLSDITSQAYWASTEYTSAVVCNPPGICAWNQLFSPPMQSFSSKNNTLSVRCVKAINF